ncbi:MAG TPA: YceI family protein [Jatrophihabitans sp.]|nr:YceI family protein [Jatrophihabitans sp.]
MTATATDFRTLTGTYTVDLAHSRFGFVARHAMVTKVRGAFNEFDGTAVIDGDNPGNSSVDVTLAVASIDTRNAQRDQHLRTNDFLDAERYPAITFKSTAVSHVAGNEFEVTGDLTIKDVTKSVSFPLEFQGAVKDPFGNDRIGFEGDVVINRRDWGVNWNAALETGGVLVSEKVTLEFEISAIKTA